MKATGHYQQGRHAADVEPYEPLCSVGASYLVFCDPRTGVEFRWTGYDRDPIEVLRGGEVTNIIERQVSDGPLSPPDGIPLVQFFLVVCVEWLAQIATHQAWGREPRAVQEVARG